MTNSEMDVLLDSVYSKIRDTRKKGNKEYAQRNAREADNVFANFERNAKALGLTREQVWGVYAGKHWDGIVSHIGGNIAQREPIQGRIIDLIVYLFLFYGMVEENEHPLLHGKHTNPEE